MHRFFCERRLGALSPAGYWACVLLVVVQGILLLRALNLGLVYLLAFLGMVVLAVYLREPATRVLTRVARGVSKAPTAGEARAEADRRALATGHLPRGNPSDPASVA